MSENAENPADDGKAAAESQKNSKGHVSIRQERCKGCCYCVEFCPLNVLLMSAKFNAKGYHFPEVADATKCNGCDLCGMYCPDFAITGTRLPKKRP